MKLLSTLQVLFVYKSADVINHSRVYAIIPVLVIGF